MKPITRAEFERIKRLFPYVRDREEQHPHEQKRFATLPQDAREEDAATENTLNHAGP